MRQGAGDDSVRPSPVQEGLTLRAFMIPAVLGLTLIAGGCQSQKSRSDCEGDVERLKGAIDRTAGYLEEVRPELKAGFLALDDCDVRFRACEPELWLKRAEAMRLEHIDVRARFTRAVDVYHPDACVAYMRGYSLNAPQPRTYNGFYYSLEETGDQIDELIERFNKRVRT